MSKVEIAYLNEFRKTGFDPNELLQFDANAARNSMLSLGVPPEAIERVLNQRTRREQYDCVLKPIQQNVETDIRTLNSKINGEVYVGGLPKHCVNASTQKVEGGYLILVNYELMQFIHQLSKIFVASTHLLKVSDGNEAKPKSVADCLEFSHSRWTKEEAIEAVRDICDCVMRGNVEEATPRRIDCEVASTFHSMLLGYSERFVVSHEYAHILQGHCDDNEPALGDYEYVRKQEAELAADMLALRLMFASVYFSIEERSQMQDAALRSAGAIFALLAKWLVDCCRDIDSAMHPNENAILSHPHIATRWDKMRTFINQRCGGITGYFDITTTWFLGIVYPVVAEVTGRDDLRELSSGTLVVDFKEV